MSLPPLFHDFFADRDWTIHPHQQAMLDAKDEASLLLIAPTGGGKTLAGFLPTLLELGAEPPPGLHTIYVSPLKALAADIKRNLMTPVVEMDLKVRVEDRTGDTTQTQRKRQRADPPHILLTTPESLALLTSYEDAPRIFRGVSRVIVDEIHALSEGKRGDQLMLCLSRLQAMEPALRRVGLSATVDDPDAIAQELACHPDPCRIVHADPGPAPDIEMLDPGVPPPWAGKGGAYAVPAVLEEVRAHRTTLIFHNTRAQAEIFFRNLWLANDEGLPIGIHHGSLSREQRAKVEGAMVRGELRAIVATGSLDLGIDWGDVDLVIQVGAPKRIKRLVQRIGRANHRYNAPSKALLVPANRFEVLECVAALEAARERDLDHDPKGPGPLDVLCQHILIRACAGPFDATALFAEVRTVGAYAALSRAAFDDCLSFCATGGYALRAYDRWQRLMEGPEGTWRLRDPRAAQRIRMNVGTIHEADMMKVRLRARGGGKPLGEVEEAFAAQLTPGDTFLIGGQTVRYEGLDQLTVEVTRRATKEPLIAAFAGYKFPTSTVLARRIMEMMQADAWPDLPEHTATWLELQRQVSRLPHPDRLLVESFGHQSRAYTCIYGFAGHNAMQTLGLLVTKRMEALGLDPLGFVATDYAVLIWGLEPVADAHALLSSENLHDGLEEWLAANALMKRTFRIVGQVALLIERNSPQARKTGRQATFSSDILYDTLAKYDPDHLLMRITRSEALRGHIDFGRVEEMLERTQGRVDHLHLDRPSPLAAPLFLEAGRVPVGTSGRMRLDETAAAEMMRAAGLDLGEVGRVGGG
ncbi:MAG: ligase-associated DNA damage response DEXH box helicase [Paracoccaceae bacterium]